MEIHEIRSLLHDVNRHDQVTHGTGAIEYVELVLLDHLKQNETDIEMWYNLVLLNLVFLHDEACAIKYLEGIRANFLEEKVTTTILLCFIQDEFMGGVEEVNFKILEALNPVDEKMKACKCYYLAKYYKDHQNNGNYAELLKESTMLYENFVHAYLDLGHFYEEQKQDHKTAQSYYYKALSSVQKIATEADIKECNFFDLNNYFDEMVFGVECTIPKYEYIKSLTIGPS